MSDGPGRSTKNKNMCSPLSTRYERRGTEEQELLQQDEEDPGLQLLTEERICYSDITSQIVRLYVFEVFLF
jgi:hypothetical protein